MSPVTSVFHTEVTVCIGLKTNIRVGTKGMVEIMMNRTVKQRPLLTFKTYEISNNSYAPNVANLRFCKIVPLIAL